MPEETKPVAGRPSLATHWPTPPGGWPAAPDAPSELDVESDGPAPAPPALPARSRPKHLPIVLGVIAGVLMLGCAAGGIATTTYFVRRANHHDPQPVVGVGRPVRDGAFQFTADRMTCGVQSIGTAGDILAPTGQFCVIRLTIQNVGKAPALFADSIQKAYGPSGAWFTADSNAALYANPDPTIFMNEINPGNKIDALIVYDIAPTAKIVRLELHENPWTTGAIIKIS